MSIVEKIRDARLLSGLSARQVAALANVSPSTVTRIEAGQASPSYDLAVRLLQANDVDQDLRPLSRPSAPAAARWLLTGDLALRPRDADDWVERWVRIRLLNEHAEVLAPRALAFRAGRAAALGNRPGAVDTARDLTWTEVGAALNAAGVDWANTGDSAANRLSSYSDQVWPAFYVSNIRAALAATGLQPRLPEEYGPRITLIPFDGISERGRWRDESGDLAGMWFADPWQVVIDCYGGTGRMPEQADRVLDGWDSA